MKKLLAGIMLTSLLAFAACGGDEEAGEDGDTADTEETTEEEAAE